VQSEVATIPSDRPSDPPPGPLSLLHITEAYNRGEISFDDWQQQTRQWAQAVIRYYQKQAGIEAIRD